MPEKILRSYKAGAYLYLEGDEDFETVFICESGTVELICSEGRIKKHKSKIIKGDIFGFIGALSKRPRLETAQCVDDCSIAILERNSFLNLLQKNSEIAIKVINYFADELRAYNEMIFIIQNMSSGNGQSGSNEDDELFSLGRFFQESRNLEGALYVYHRYMELYPRGEHHDEINALISSLSEQGINSVTQPEANGIHRIYAPNQVIFCEGEPGSELYIVKEGMVKITKRNGNAEVTLSILKEGDIFGELAIVSEKTRNATAISFNRSVILPITKDSLIKLLQKSPEILKKIFTAISNRVWFTYIRLEAALYSQPVTRLYAFIESKLLENRVSVYETHQVTLNHGIDELLNMAGLSHENDREAINIILQDKNFSFNFGQIVIADPSDVFHRSRFYKTRDTIAS